MRMLLPFLILCCLPVIGAVTDEEYEEYEIYKEARRHWFDSEWTEALQDFNRLVERYPDSSRRCKCESYVGYCYAKLGDRRKALETFDRLAKSACKTDIVNDAKSERLKLAFELIGEDGSMEAILLDGLRDENSDIRFIAAIFLARLDIDAGLPVFFDVVANDPDPDRRDTAYRWILKLGSEADKRRLEEIIAARKASGEAPKMIRLVIRNVETDEVEHRIQVPIRLFNAIIKMLREDQMQVINQEYGIDLENLEIDLESMKSGTVLFQVIDRNKQEIKIVLE